MKKLIRIICLTLVFCLLCGTGVSAETAVTPRANTYIAAHTTFLYKTAFNQFQVWFDITANAMDIDEIGVTQIEVYRSSDQKSWTKMKTYKYTDYPEMMDYDSTFHSGYVTYKYATPGYYYKAYIAFYAANSTGAGRVYRYTAILQM